MSVASPVAGSTANCEYFSQCLQSKALSQVLEITRPASSWRQRRSDSRHSAKFDCPTGAKVASGAPDRRDDRRRNRQHDGEKQRQENDVGSGPMESINPRKHGCFLLLALRTGAGSDRTANRE